MRLDPGNRSFVMLFAVATGLYLALSAAACAVLALVAYRLCKASTSRKRWSTPPGLTLLRSSRSGSSSAWPIRRHCPIPTTGSTS